MHFVDGRVAESTGDRPATSTYCTLPRLSSTSRPVLLRACEPSTRRVCAWRGNMRLPSSLAPSGTRPVTGTGRRRLPHRTQRHQADGNNIDFKRGVQMRQVSGRRAMQWHGRLTLALAALLGSSVVSCVTTVPPSQEAPAPAPVAAPAYVPPPVAAEAEPPADDPPARVGRLALVEGRVSFRPASDT